MTTVNVCGRTTKGIDYKSYRNKGIDYKGYWQQRVSAKKDI